ncbi:hypothetical protein NQ318_012644 [Aromia moschata]|uniref:DDE-1 domain-containing protein n=1 Tax=Aromia moschata TaxID=1265417 RepID=A0AAV8XMT9_9CUCU|nr:hypothetical protein NQ318_012644 [Aromia moschata]
MYLIKAAVLQHHYPLENIYNADEFGLQYKSLPKKTLVLPNEKEVPGHKPVKERITVMVCANASGTYKIPLLAIGKYQKPRCFNRCNMSAKQRLDERRHFPEVVHQLVRATCYTVPSHVTNVFEHALRNESSRSVTYGDIAALLNKIPGGDACSVQEAQQWLDEKLQVFRVLTDAELLNRCRNSQSTGTLEASDNNF